MSCSCGTSSSCTCGSPVVGKQVARRTTFLDADGDPVSPVSVTATIKKPDGTLATPSPAAESTGVYLTVFPIFDQKGIWHFKIVGTGGTYDVDQGQIRVGAAEF